MCPIQHTQGCLAEKQLLRRQLMLTLQSGQAPDADQVAAAAMAAAATGNAMASMTAGAPAGAAAVGPGAAAVAGLGSLAGLGVAPAVALGAARASPAAQLQALMDARSAATAGVPAAVATAATSPQMAAAAAPAAGTGGYAAPDLLTRVSLKIMNCLPDELPPDVRSRMQAFASQAPLDLVQGCLRPGELQLLFLPTSEPHPQFSLYPDYFNQFLILCSDIIPDTVHDLFTLCMQ